MNKKLKNEMEAKIQSETTTDSFTIKNTRTIKGVKYLRILVNEHTLFGFDIIKLEKITGYKLLNINSYTDRLEILLIKEDK